MNWKTALVFMGCVIAFFAVGDGVLFFAVAFFTKTEPSKLLAPYLVVLLSAAVAGPLVCWAQSPSCPVDTRLRRLGITQLVATPIFSLAVFWAGLRVGLLPRADFQAAAVISIGTGVAAFILTPIVGKAMVHRS